MKVVQVITDAGHADTVSGIAEQQQALDCWVSAPSEDGRVLVEMLVPVGQVQKVLDALAGALGGSETSRTLVSSVEAVWPRPAEPEADVEKKKAGAAVSREELYYDLERGSRLDRNFLLLVFLSTVVAAIGLVENNVAVVIGAMVIAPLLGPNLALAFGTSMGDTALIGRATATLLVGLLFAVTLSVGIGLAWHVDLTSDELMTRTTVGLDSVALAMASGAAAVLSVTTGLSSVLVGVMVAVALLPPATTLGLMLSAQQWALAEGALLLLAINIVCLNLSAKLVLLFKGIRPRTWLEKKKARQSMVVYVTTWLLSLLVLLLLVFWKQI